MRFRMAEPGDGKVAQSNLPTNTGTPVSTYNQRVPTEGPKIVPLRCDFSVSQVQSFNLAQILTQSLISLIQGYFIDNSGNASAVTIQALATQQAVVLPPGYQGFIPAFVGLSDTLVISSASSNVAHVYLYNMAMPLGVWPTTQVIPKFGPGGALIVQLTPLVATVVNRGGTITAGGTAQTLAPANAARLGLVIQNPVEATENLYIAVAGAATVGGAGNFADLAPGGSCSLSVDDVIIQTGVSVNAATTGHLWIATEL
jgi:hypothetical protein